MIIPHILFAPMPADRPARDSDWLSTFLIWMAPFLIVYLWHWWHDHRHNHVLEKRLKEIVDRLDRILAQTGRGGSS